ncbi:MAG: aminopeptidase [Rickettsiales bacterium]|nr:MAG: aminopeptidase [Rickettsiales bacterium]
MIEKKLGLLREQLNKHGFGGYIVPSVDEYLSEFTPSFAKRLEYITGFTGSNGLAMILADTVLFFTDGRYIEQAFTQLDDKLFEVFDQKLLANFPWEDYLESDCIVAYDPKLLTMRALQSFNSISTKPYEENLIDQQWADQPAKPSSKIYDYPTKYAGADYEDKISQCREFLQENDAASLVITDPDSVCWLLNIRAHDIEFSPLLLANAIITMENLYLFTDAGRLDSELLRPDVTILDESEFGDTLKQTSGLILFDVNTCSSYIAELIMAQKYKQVKNPCLLWKACKNDTEIMHMQQGHVQDAVAVCEILSFLASGDVSDLTEYDISEKLTELRAAREGYVFDSFPTICGYRENGAIIHYRAQAGSAKKLEESGLLLIDSGGQYMGATTDITRTVAIGEKPSAEHIKYYTKVLKGHIALGQATFPEKVITGANLDILARQYLWNDGRDYPHGTGHGVGSFLSVHEPPQSISLFSTKTALEAGMVLSNEPGYYVPGAFGIRIENMMYVTKSEHAHFLKFKMLTLVPYAKELIDENMLTDAEKLYLKSYYQEINHHVSPLLSSAAQQWLKGQID